MIKLVQKFTLIISAAVCGALHAADSAEPFLCKVPRQAQEAENLVAAPEELALIQDYDFEIPKDPEAAERYKKVKARFCKQFNLSLLHPEIAQEVRKALQAYNITEPVIVLQDENETGSACYAPLDDLHHPVICMRICVADARGSAPIEFIRHSLFHECAHIAHGDLARHHKPASTVKSWVFLSAVVGAGVGAGIKTYKTLCPKIGKPSSIALGIGAGLITPFIVGRLYHKTVDAYHQRDVERKADKAAAQKLIEVGEIETLVVEFIDLTYWLDKGVQNMKNEFWLFYDHPCYKERTQIVVDALETANIDTTKFPANIDEDLKQRFATQLKKYFPARVAFFKV